MKKFVFTGLLCFLVSLSFGQKKAINAAKNEIKGNNPNFTEARTLIRGALANPETANDAEAWFVAGQIENKQFDKEKEKEILGRQPDEELMYTALENFLPYFIKAAELDQQPDAKGKVRTKFLKDIRSIMRANRPYFINAGIFAYDKHDYRKAYENFKLYGDIPKLSLYDGDKWNISPRDTTELQFRYYAALAASQIPEHKLAIDIYEEIKNLGFNENEIYQRLAYEYNQVEDSTSFERIIKEGFAKFPDDEYFLLNLINICIYSGKPAEAIAYLDQAIAQHPENAQLYDVLGQIYEADNRPDEAIMNLNKALEMEPDNVDFLSHIGRVYFNLGIEKRGEADNISDFNKSNEVHKEALEFFRKSMPYFEKIHRREPKNMDAIFALHSIYYILGMPEYEKMNVLLNRDDD